jgi:zinc protease
VGDFEPEEMVRRVERLTATWQRVDLPRPTPSSPPVAAGIERIITDPTAAQTHVFLGQLGITRTNPDYYKLLVMDNVLGTGPGFTDRLSSTLRDRQGLAYTVTAQITGTASDQPGAFIGYVGTFPDKYTWVRESFVKEIRRIREEPPTHQEVEDAKSYLLGRLPFKLATLQDMATQLLTAERYGLGLNFLEDYRRQVAAVTPADVQAVARKYLAPDTFAIIAVGPIDPQGQPLAAKGQAK